MNTPHTNLASMKDQWTKLKSKVKAKWSALTEQDVSSIDGSGELLTAKVTERCGCSHDEAKRQVDQFCTDNQVSTATKKSAPTHITPSTDPKPPTGKAPAEATHNSPATRPSPAGTAKKSK